MAASPSSKIPAAEKSDRELAGGAEAKDRRALLWGGGLAAVCAVSVIAFLVWLQNYKFLPPDPDANTPVITPDYPRHLVDFTLKDQAGHTVTRSDLDGKILVIDFIFTNCSITCPYVNAQMGKVQDATASMPDVRLLSLTLDPADDTVPVLAAYAPGFHANARRWLFLTGDDNAIHNLVATSFLPPDTGGQFAYMPGNFAHVQRIVLVDRKGDVVCYFDGLNQNAGEVIIERIRKMEGSR
jgi:cytochrome oxidase Cu insertion factor (SCO1/SenC/PrrC family)